MLTYADVCWRMLTYADVCWRKSKFLLSSNFDFCSSMMSWRRFCCGLNGNLPHAMPCSVQTQDIFSRWWPRSGCGRIARRSGSTSGWAFGCWSPHSPSQTADGFQTAVTETDPNLPDLQPHGIPLTAITDLELRCVRVQRKKDITPLLLVLLLIVLYVYVQQVYALKIRPWWRRDFG
jgi:hypothetical protein